MQRNRESAQAAAAPPQSTQLAGDCYRGRSLHTRATCTSGGMLHGRAQAGRCGHAPLMQRLNQAPLRTGWHAARPRAGRQTRPCSPHAETEPAPLRTGWQAARARRKHSTARSAARAGSSAASAPNACPCSASSLQTHIRTHTPAVAVACSGRGIPPRCQSCAPVRAAGARRRQPTPNRRRSLDLGVQPPVGVPLAQHPPLQPPRVVQVSPAAGPPVPRRRGRRHELPRGGRRRDARLRLLRLFLLLLLVTRPSPRPALCSPRAQATVRAQAPPCRSQHGVRRGGPCAQTRFGVTRSHLCTPLRHTRNAAKRAVL